MKYIKTFEQFINENKVNEDSFSDDDFKSLLKDLDDSTTKSEVIKLFKKGYQDYSEKDAKEDGAEWIDPKILYNIIEKLPNNVYYFFDGDGNYDLYEYIDTDNEFKFKKEEVIQVGPYDKGFKLNSDGTYDELLKKGKKIRNLGYGDFFILNKVVGNGITLYRLESDISFGDRSTPEEYWYFFDNKNLKLLKEYIKSRI